MAEHDNGPGASAPGPVTDHSSTTHGTASVVRRSMDDIGNGQRLADHFGHVLRWVRPVMPNHFEDPPRGREGWHVLTGDGRWQRDAVAARSYVHRMLEALPTTEAPLYPPGPERDAFLAWVARSRSSERIEAALLLAASVPGMSQTVTVEPDRGRRHRPPAWTYPDAWDESEEGDE